MKCVIEEEQRIEYHLYHTKVCEYDPTNIHVEHRETSHSIISILSLCPGVIHVVLLRSRLIQR